MKTPQNRIESLEARIAPASVFTYTDVDGDQVKITSSKGNLQDHVTLEAAGSGDQLLMLDLRDDSFANTNLKIAVKRAPGGDGFANIGFLNAADNDLGKIQIQGDLGRIVAGDSNEGTPAIKSLKVHSLGQYGLSTQGGELPGGDGGLSPLVSDLLQDLIGPTGVGGGLLEDISTAVTNLLGSGEADDSGTLFRLLTNLDANLNSLLQTTGLWQGLPDGSRGLIGNVAHLISGLLEANGEGEGLLGLNLKTILTAADDKLGDILEEILPGLGLGLNLNNLLGLDLDALLGLNLGGLGDTAGSLLQTLETTITNLLGGAEFDQLPLNLQELIGRIDGLLDPILGDDQPLTTQVIGLLTDLQSELAGLLGLGNLLPDVLPGNLQDLLEPALGTVTSLLGGTSTDGEGGGEEALNLTSTIRGNVGSILVAGNVRDAFLHIQGDVKKIQIRGGLMGDELDNGGQLLIAGDLGSLQIKRGVVGGVGINSGSITVNGDAGSIYILGSLVGGTGAHSGSISLHSDLQALTIRGDIAGGEGALSGTVENDNGGIKKVDLRRSLIAGEGEGSGALSVSNDIKNIRIDGSMVGDSERHAVLSAAGLESKTGAKNLALGKIQVRGSVQFADILAGYDTDLEAVNGDAQIKSVTVNRDWVASNLVAGIESIAGIASFGTETNTVIAGGNTGAIVASIASIQIKGSISGTTASGDQYGFVAESIGKMKINKTKVPLSGGAGNDSAPLANLTNDVFLKEVTATAL